VSNKDANKDAVFALLFNTSLAIMRFVY